MATRIWRMSGNRETRRYGVECMTLSVRVSRRVRDRLYASIPDGVRGRFVENALIEALDKIATDRTARRVVGEGLLGDTQTDEGSTQGR